MESNIATSWKKSKHYRGKKKWKLWFYYDFIMETLILLWFYLQIDQLFPADFPMKLSAYKSTTSSRWCNNACLCGFSCKKPVKKGSVKWNHWQ